MYIPLTTQTGLYFFTPTVGGTPPTITDIGIELNPNPISIQYNEITYDVTVSRYNGLELNSHNNIISDYNKFYIVNAGDTIVSAYSNVVTLNNIGFNSKSIVDNTGGLIDNDVPTPSSPVYIYFETSQSVSIEKLHIYGYSLNSTFDCDKNIGSCKLQFNTTSLKSSDWYCLR